MPPEHERRRGALVDALVGRDLDAALVTDLVNVRYLTGFTGSNAALVVDVTGRHVFATDGRYAEQAATECGDLRHVISRELLPALVDAVGDRPGWRCALETHALSVDAHGALTALLQGTGRWTLTSLQRAVEGLREVKDEAELAALRAACEVSTAALGGLLSGRLRGRSERALARDLESRMYDHGAEAVGFDTIVASGPHSAIPHHQPTERVVGRGDLLKIDFGARVDGYHADCTRTVVIGAAADWQQEIHAAVAAAQRDSIAALGVGVLVADVDAAARRSLDRAGYLDHFPTGLGHGVGLVIHEDPFLGKGRPGRLRAHTALTIEPGVYLRGRGGVRIEDTLVVTDAGSDFLTTAPRDLLVSD